MKFLSGKWILGVKIWVDLLMFTAEWQTVSFYLLDSMWMTSHMRSSIQVASTTSGCHPPTSSSSVLKVSNNWLKVCCYMLTLHSYFAAGQASLQENRITSLEKFTEVLKCLQVLWLVFFFFSLFLLIIW